MYQDDYYETFRRMNELAAQEASERALFWTALVLGLAAAWLWWALIWPPLVRRARQRTEPAAGVAWSTMKPADTAHGLLAGFSVWLLTRGVSMFVPDGVAGIALELLVALLAIVVVSTRMMGLRPLPALFIGFFGVLVQTAVTVVGSIGLGVAGELLGLGRKLPWVAAASLPVLLVATIVAGRRDQRRDNLVWTESQTWGSASGQGGTGWHDDDRVSLSDLPMR